MCKPTVPVHVSEDARSGTRFEVLMTWLLVLAGCDLLPLSTLYYFHSHQPPHRRTYVFDLKRKSVRHRRVGRRQRTSFQ